MIPYPYWANSGSIRQLAASMGQFSTGVADNASAITQTTQTATQSANWTGRAAEAFTKNMEGRSNTMASIAQVFAGTAVPLNTFAAAIDTTRMQHQTGVALETKGYALMSNPWTASLGAALVAKGNAMQGLAVAALQAAGMACAGKLAMSSAKVLAAEFAGVDPKQFDAIVEGATSAWESIEQAMFGPDGQVRVDVIPETVTREIESRLSTFFDNPVGPMAATTDSTSDLWRDIVTGSGTWVAPLTGMVASGALSAPAREDRQRRPSPWRGAPTLVSGGTTQEQVGAVFATSTGGRRVTVPSVDSFGESRSSGQTQVAGGSRRLSDAGIVDLDPNGPSSVGSSSLGGGSGRSTGASVPPPAVTAGDTPSATSPVVGAAVGTEAENDRRQPVAVRQPA